MSQKLVDRSPDLKRLRDEGFDLQVMGTHLLVKSIPYVNGAKEVKRGVLVSTLEFAQNNVKKPDEHTVWFAGERPCDEHGTPIGIIISDQRTTPVPGFDVDFMFSTKPRDGKGYPDYYAKITTYAKILMHPAQAIDSTTKAQVFPVIATEMDEGSPFKYFDTSSSRAGIDALSPKLAMAKIAIVGLGGTGSYILDMVAKTRVCEIHLFDDDDFNQHNAFRCPGALGIEELKPDMKKVEYYRDLYSKFRHGVIAHPYRIDIGNHRQYRRASPGAVRISVSRQRRAEGSDHARTGGCRYPVH